MKRLFVTCLLLLFAFSAWGYGYRLVIDSQGEGRVQLVAESQVNAAGGWQQADFGTGETELLYENDEEYVVLGIALSDPATLVKVEIWYLDADGEPVTELPEKLIFQGKAVVTRLCHPLARIPPGVL